jgi:hypothetical protein
MQSLEATASMRVSKLPRELSLVRRMSAGEKSEKTSSAESGSSQNCGCQQVAFQYSFDIFPVRSPPAPQHRASCMPEVKSNIPTYTCPVRIVCGYVLLLGEAEYALFEIEFGVGGTHLLDHASKLLICELFPRIPSRLLWVQIANQSTTVNRGSPTTSDNR